MSFSLEGIDDTTALLAIQFFLDDLDDLTSPSNDANAKAAASLLQEDLEDVRLPSVIVEWPGASRPP